MHLYATACLIFDRNQKSASIRDRLSKIRHKNEKVNLYATAFLKFDRKWNYAPIQYLKNEIYKGMKIVSYTRPILWNSIETKKAFNLNPNPNPNPNSNPNPKPNLNPNPNLLKIYYLKFDR